MDHRDHVNLLRGGVQTPSGLWADFGSGAGAFTLSLAELLGDGAQIISIDKDASALRAQERTLRSRFPHARVEYRVADFSAPLDLPPLDGIVMANALHYQRDKQPLVRSLKGYLQPDGRFVLVEYNVDQGNPWVPYPLSFATWQQLAARCGFAHTQWLAGVPSRFLKEIYSAVSWGCSATT